MSTITKSKGGGGRPRVFAPPDWRWFLREIRAAKERGLNPTFKVPLYVSHDCGKTRELTGKFSLIDLGDYPRAALHYWYLGGESRRQYAKSSRRRLLHRMILNVPRGVIIDHINGDGLDNRRSNLRICTCAENLRNARKRLGTASQYKGVRVQGNKYVAQIHAPSVRRYLGTFPTEIEAALAYDAAAREHFGEFANPNFPEASNG